VPVRRAFFDLPGRPESDAASGGGGGPHLLVLGGSQGARQLNRDLPAALAAAGGGGGLAGVTVLHQAGRGHEEVAAEAYRAAGFAAGRGAVEVAGFVADVAAAMGAADLVVSRAGAITIAEICAAGRASLLVPLALAGGHQEGNARRMAEAGAAVVVASDAGPERLGAALGGLLADRGRLAAMGRAARALARPDAAAAIAGRVEALAEREAA
jgi:UDP-N-acetylglucosamine--N-acetylmuramyl-(pentapeptide) pyrophosphoryl-undecaprenol N-acetylglucosamine transferase